jgi:hypothetical protein
LLDALYVHEKAGDWAVTAQPLPVPVASDTRKVPAHVAVDDWLADAVPCAPPRFTAENVFRLGATIESEPWFRVTLAATPQESVVLPGEVAGQLAAKALPAPTSDAPASRAAAALSPKSFRMM